ncbi:MAG: hypothetical protein DMG82_15295 [Acidobacteria bacterium]|nr:MAG: hypothetical protein DMG82_15295 [Acidobacteriota bacterium]
MHVAPLHNLFLADDGDVVLRLACDHAIVAAHTGVQIDGHAPGIFLLGVVDVRVERQLARRLLFLRELRLLAIFLEARFPNQRPMCAVGRVHGLIALGGSEFVGRARFREFASGRDPQRRRRAQRVDIEAGARSGATGARASVAKVDGDGIVGMSGLHPDRPGNFAPREFDRDHVLRLELFALGHLGADQDGIVPGQFRHRLGKFLQPAVVGELAVVNGRVSAEIDLKRLLIGGGGFRWNVGLGGNGFRSIGRSLDPPIVQRLAPEGFEVAAGMLLLPVGADQVVSGRVGDSGECRDEFMSALAGVEWRDQGLNDAGGSVVRAGIAPGFKRVRFVYMPVAILGGLILVETVMDPDRDVGSLERIGEAEIGRRIVDRIAAHDDQHVDFARPHVGNQVAQGLGLIDGISVDRVGIDDRLTNVSERAVYRMCQRVDQRRLVLAGNHHTRTMVPSKITHQGLEKSALVSI